MADTKISALAALAAAANDDELVIVDTSAGITKKITALALATHTHDGQTLQLDGVNSNGGAFPFTTTGKVTFNQDIGTNGDIYLLDTKSIGIGPALERLEFYAAGRASFEGCWLTATGGIHVGGTADPGTDNLIVDGDVGIGKVPTVALDILKDANEVPVAVFTNSGDTNPYGIRIDFTAADPDNQTEYFIKGKDQTAGEFTIYSDGAFVQASDERTKTTPKNTRTWLDKVLNLQIKEYEKKHDTSKRLNVGIIASEIMEDFGHLVNIINKKMDNDYDETQLEDQYMLNYIGFIPIALKVSQEIKEEKDTEIEELKQRIQLLEAA